MRIRASAVGDGIAAKRVLVVDDDADLRDALVDLLRWLGFTAIGVGSVADARVAIERYPYDALISDLELPDEDGFDLARWLRSHPDPWLRSIPALAVSALCSLEHRREALAAGFVGFVAKPYEVNDIRRAMSALCERFGDGAVQSGTGSVD